MTLVQILLVLAVVAGVAVVAAGLVGGGLSAPTRTLPWTGLGDGDVSPQDVEAVRFAVGLRGYRMDQVDEVLDRLAAEIARRDAEIARLRDTEADRLADPADARDGA